MRKKKVYSHESILKHFFNGQVWNTDLAFEELSQLGCAGTKRTAERRMHEIELWPTELKHTSLKDEFNRPLNSLVLEKKLEHARSKRMLILFAQIHVITNGMTFIHLNNAKGARFWIALKGGVNEVSVSQAIDKIYIFLNKPAAIYPHGQLVSYFRGYLPLQKHSTLTAYRETSTTCPDHHPNLKKMGGLPPHLARLEAESIFIFREAVSQSKNPAMLYSIGKDSSVMLELAKKAFYPGKIPFPLVHVDTRWKFQAMYEMRDKIAQDPNITLLIHTNPDAIKRNINPFDHGSELHTDITKTEGLKQVLDHYQFDAIFGGARRDEEKSRAKERIFSFRTKTHYWDPKNQRPELWNLFNAKINQGESIRVFPLSNWTELDIWEYIYYKQIPVVPLYFAKKRPIIQRNNLLLVLDDERFRLNPNEKITDKIVRFRTLGCYPLTGAIESEARNVSEIILELLSTNQTERQGRAIDSDVNASMEKKKQEGYF